MMKKITQAMIASCPDCGESIDLGPQVEEGEMVTCPECWAYLKVINLEPLVLSWDSFEDDEDDDEEDDDDESDDIRHRPQIATVGEYEDVA
jgi:lysine biosynthesis protein LysW